MLSRGLTAEALACAAGISRGTSYNALHGKLVRLRTARLILEALASVEPTLDVVVALLDG
jgi:predicted transcriptional regulator